MFLKRFWLLLSAIVILFPSWGSAQESTLDVAKRRGWVVAGVKNDFPPLGYLDQSGKWVGLDLEMAQYVAKKLGVELRPEAITSRTRIPMLVNGNVDFVVQINPTRERAQTVDFTIPYFHAGHTLLVHTDSGIRSIDDLAGRKTGTVQGSADGPGLLAFQPKTELVLFQEPPQVFLALRQRRIDAMTTSSILLQVMSKNEPDMVVIDRPFKPDPLPAE
jgi:polar amino acid transport system substrate-binding protein